MVKILLVEDDSNLREIYGARLEAEGYEIAAASDGEEALAMAVRERPALIISDVMMPKISGFDMLDIIRSTPETKDVKVIVMTALSQEEDRRRGVELGADRYVVKSQVTLEDIVVMVRDLLAAAPTTQPDPSQATTDDTATTDDPATLSQEVEQFVASSPLMGGSQQSVQTQPPQQPVNQEQTVPTVPPQNQV